MKMCGTCKTPKSLDDFWKNSRSKDGYGWHCKPCFTVYKDKWKKSDRGRESAIDYKKRKKQIVLDHYGHVCACPGCKITDFDFLTIDHIEGNGAAHRKELGGQWVYTWLIANNFPPGFQLLCYNCNCAKKNKPACPVHNLET